MNWKDVSIGALLVIAVLLAWVFLDEKKRNGMLKRAIVKLEKDHEQLKLDYLDLLQKVLEIDERMTPDVVRELEQLKEKAQYLDALVHVELSSVIDLVNSGKHEKAVKDLAKIIENVLKMKAEKDQEFKGKCTLENLINFAGIKEWISKEEVALAHLLRGHRNEESHQLAIKKPLHEMGLHIFAGIKIIYRLYQPNQ